MDLNLINRLQEINLNQKQWNSDFDERLMKVLKGGSVDSANKPISDSEKKLWIEHEKEGKKIFGERWKYANVGWSIDNVDKNIASKVYGKPYAIIFTTYMDDQGNIRHKEHPYESKLVENNTFKLEGDRPDVDYEKDGNKIWLRHNGKRLEVRNQCNNCSNYFDISDPVPYEEGQKHYYVCNKCSTVNHL